MKSKPLSNGLFGIGLVLVIVACIGMSSGSYQWSDGMIKRAGLGFAHKVESPLMAIELADSPENFALVFGFDSKHNPIVNPITNPAVIADVGMARHNLAWDYVFLLGYSLLFSGVVLRLLQMGAIASEKTAQRLLILVVFVALMDICENSLFMFVCSSATEGSVSLTYCGLEHVASLAKWASSFVMALFLGVIILRTQNASDDVKERFGGTWCLAGLLYLVAAVTGLIGVFDEVLFAPAFLIMGMGGLVLVGVWVGPFLAKRLWPESPKAAVEKDTLLKPPH